MTILLDSDMFFVEEKMDTKPDYRFTKLHTAKGTVYTFSIFIGIEESFHGYGSTITEAVKKACVACNQRYDELKELEEVHKFVNVMNENIAVNNVFFDKAIKNNPKKEGQRRSCQVCGKLIEDSRRRKFCSDTCMSKSFQRNKNARKSSK